MDETPTTGGGPPSRPGRPRGLVGGVILIVLGALLLLDRVVPDIRFSDYWPVLLIVIGLLFLFGLRRQ